MYLWFRPLSETHLYAAMRYVECNPVRAGIVKKAEDYPWSSARAHVHKMRDHLLSDNFVIEKISDWQSYLADDEGGTGNAVYARHADTGRPLGEDSFISELERLTGRVLHKKKRGPKKKEIIK